MISALCECPNRSAAAIVTALPFLIRKNRDEYLYRVYMTEMLRGVTGANVSYYKLIDDEPEPVDDRTGDEIALDIIKRAGLEVKS